MLARLLRQLLVAEFLANLVAHVVERLLHRLLVLIDPDQDDMVRSEFDRIGRVAFGENCA